METNYKKLYHKIKNTQIVNKLDYKIGFKFWNSNIVDFIATNKTIDKIDNMLYKYIIKPKSQRTLTKHDILLIGAISWIPVIVTIGILFPKIISNYQYTDMSKIADKCIIQYKYMDENWNDIYMCQSKNDKTEFYLFSENDTRGIDNIYIKRQIWIDENDEPNPKKYENYNLMKIGKTRDE